MSTTTQLRTAIAIAALSFLAVSPALGQGNGKAKGKERNRAPSAQVERQRPTLQRRGGSEASRPRYKDRDARRLDRDDDGRNRSRDRFEDRDDDRRNRRDDRFERRNISWEDILFGRDDRRHRKVPPGWCRGRGNPHNTPENCGWKSFEF